MSNKVVTYTTKDKLPCGNGCNSSKVIICLKQTSTNTSGCGCTNICNSGLFVEAIVTGSQVSEKGWFRYTLVYSDVNLPGGYTSICEDNISQVICDDCLLSWIKNYVTTHPFGVPNYEAGLLTEYQNLADQSNYALSLDSAGNVVRKLKVLARAQVSNATAVTSFPSLAETLIDFDSIVFDNLNLITTGAGWKFKVPVTGIYKIETNFYGGNIQIEGINGNYPNIILSLFRSGIKYEDISGASHESTLITNEFVFGHGSITTQLNALDMIDIRLNVRNSSQNIPLLTVRPSLTRFAIERINL